MFDVFVYNDCYIEKCMAKLAYILMNINKHLTGGFTSRLTIYKS